MFCRGMVIYLILWLFVGVSHAQTATPHPNALTPGKYLFESLSSPQIELTGTGWTIAQLGVSGRFGLNTDDNGDSLLFRVHESVDTFTIWADSDNSQNPDWEICIDAACSDYNDGNNNDPAQYAFENTTNSEVTITKSSGGNTMFYTIELDDNDPVQVVVSGTTPQSTPTPAPYYIYGSVSGSSGDVDTRFDMIVTAGDVAIASSLLFLFFSIWAFILIYFTGRDRV